MFFVNNAEIGNKKSLLKIWFLFFIYTAFISLLIQFVILPYIFPQFHYKDGLFISLYDCQNFHEVAMQKAQQIHQYGWKMWELRPCRHAPAGIASIIYTLTVPKLWTLIPLNAFLHATSALILLCIINMLLKNLKLSLFCVLPFLLYPTAISWYAQLHKDGFTILGNFFILWGWIRILLMNKNSHKIKFTLITIFYFFVGIFLIWLMRIYLLRLEVLVSFIFTIILGIYFIYEWHIKKISKFTLKINIILLIFIITAITGFMLFVTLPKNNVCQQENKTSMMIQNVANDNSLSTLIKERESYRSSIAVGNSDIDKNIVYDTPWKLFIYSPRILQIGLLAPFPSFWFQRASVEANGMLRKLVGLEMLGVYFALFFLPFSLWYWRKSIVMWVLFLFNFCILFVYSVVVLNVGTLHRMRYGYLMSLVALGLAGFMAILRDYKLKKSKN